MTSKHVHHGDQFHFNADQDIRDRTKSYFAEAGQPCSEWINWLLPLDDQTIMNKDGSMMAVFEMQGLDTESNGVEKFNQARNQAAYALSQLQEKNVTMWWQVRRRITQDYPGGEFPHTTGELINAELKAEFLRNAQYVNKHHVVLIMSPWDNSIRMLAGLRRSQEKKQGTMGAVKALANGIKSMIAGQSIFPYESVEELQEMLEQFKSHVDLLVSSMSSDIGLRILRGGQLGRFLNVASSPTSKLDGEDIDLARYGLDVHAPTVEIDNSMREMLKFEWNHETVWGQCYSLDFTVTKELSVDMLDGMLAAPFEFTLSHCMQLLPRPKGERSVAAHENYHAARRYPIKAYLAGLLGKAELNKESINSHRDKAAKEAEAFKNSISASQDGVGLYYGTIMVQSHSPDVLVESSKRCEELLQSKQIKPILERLHKFSSFASTVPGSHHEVAKWGKLDRLNFVDLCPIRTFLPGDRINTYLTEQTGQKCEALLALPTRSRIPYYFTGYVGDLGHLIMIGPSATGKTSFVTLALSQFRKYPKSNVIIFDKKYSTRPTVLLQGGKYLDLTPDNQTGSVAHMGPLTMLAPDQGGRHFEFVAGWIELLAKQRGYSATAQDRIKLESVLKATQEMAQKDPSVLTLSTVLVQLDMVTPFAQALQPWTKGQIYGRYFDNATDDFDLTSLVAAENGSLLDSEELSVPFMQLQFYRIASQLREFKDDGSIAPTLIYIPELWYFVRNKGFREMLFEWLVTLRSLNACVWFDTQSPDRLIESDIWSSMRDNIATVVLTPNAKALTSSLSSKLRDEFMLTEEALQFVANGVPKQDYLIMSGGITRRVRLPINKTIMACLRADKKAQTLLSKYLDRHDFDIADYIREINDEE